MASALVIVALATVPSPGALQTTPAAQTANETTRNDGDPPTDLTRELTPEQREHSKLFASEYDPYGTPLRQLFIEGAITGVGPIEREYVSRDNRPRTVREYFASLEATSDVVVVGTVQSNVSFFTATDAFLLTDSTVEVEQQFSCKKGFVFARGSRLVVTRPGGAVEYAGRIFRAIDPMYEPLRTGERRYLLFLNVGNTSGAFVPVSPGAVFEIEGDALRSMTDAPRPFELERDLNNTTWKRAREILLREAVPYTIR
jgi:hypothetical protein